MLTEKAFQSLKNVLSKGQVFTDAASLISYEVDAGMDRGRPEAVVFPHTAANIVQLVQWAAQHDVPLVARGAGTGLSGGAVAERGGIIVEFSRMNHLLDIDESGRRAVVEPGLINLRLDEQVRQRGLYFPPDPASQRASTIGGNVSENSGGPHCFKYGVTTNYVMGMRVVLADGREVQVGGQAMDYPTYDLCGLITGSEGMLALMTAIDVRLVRNPPAIKTMLAVFDSVEQAGTAVSAVIAAGLVPATMEMMDQKIIRIVEDYAHAGLPTEAEAMLIVEVDGYATSLDSQIAEISTLLLANGGRDLRVAQTDEERNQIWFARKSAAGAVSRLTPFYYTIDITVPRSRLVEMLSEVNAICDRYSLRVGYVFHAGDGNLHPLVLIPDNQDKALMERVHSATHEMVELAVKKEGSLSGEHGIGIEKRAFMSLMHTPDELTTMLDIKASFDPHGLFNPGKIFPTPTNDTTATRGNVGATLAVAQGKNGVITYAPDDLYITVGAGTPLADIQAYLAPDRKQVPMLSPWPQATIGEIITANVNAPLRMRYGAIRDLVLCATVVLGNGRKIRTGRPVIKNVAGYDLTKVFIGSHGTLGMIVDVTLKLVVQPRLSRTLLIPIENLEQGLVWGSKVVSVALVASAIVLCNHGIDGGLETPYTLAYTAEGTAADVEAELSEVRQVLQAHGGPKPIEVDAPTGSTLWATLLGSTPSTLQVRVGVPPQDKANYMKDQIASLHKGIFLADMSSGLLYATLATHDLQEASSWLVQLRKPALARGGYATVIAMPRDWENQLDRWGYYPETLDVMRRLKARWDPQGILPRAFLAP